MRLHVIGHLRNTFKDCCWSMPISFSIIPVAGFGWGDCIWPWAKLLFILATAWSAGRRFLLSSVWSTCRTDGRWTSCRTNRWDWKCLLLAIGNQRNKIHKNSRNNKCWRWFGWCFCRVDRLASDTKDDACFCSRHDQFPMALSWLTLEHWPANLCSSVGLRDGNIWAEARDPIDTWGCCKRLALVEIRGY